MAVSEQMSVSYIYHKSLVDICDIHPQSDISGRARLVHNLIHSYGLLQNTTVITNRIASKEDLESFHSKEYIHFLEMVSESNDIEKFEEEQEDFGLGYDCPLFQSIYEFAQLVAGSSLTAALALINGISKVSINWFGGWHHAQRDSADGFCYVNDIVIAIHKLLEKYSRVLYIDLDVHHGNGVENAFSHTDKVLTLSFHKHEPGFYPNSGALTDVGYFKGKFYTVNVPLKDGIRDSPYFSLFDSVASLVQQAFDPKAIVVQCGADSLTGDPLGGFNLTPKGLGKCVHKILSWNLPTMFLGGGGYNAPNVARCWTYLTSVIVGQEIPAEIPSDQDWESYGPYFELDISPGARADLNTKAELAHIVQIVGDNLKHISI